MRKGKAFIAAVLLISGAWAYAQQADERYLFNGYNTSVSRDRSLTLTDTTRFSFLNGYSALEWIPFNFLPPELTIANTTVTSPKPAKASVTTQDSSKEVPEMRRPLFDYVSGEVGFMYGRSVGKHSGDVEAGYILGEAGNDKTQISVGASYERSSARAPRFSR